jgi:uncharacterized protein YndB with AHSA1/START domain
MIKKNNITCLFVSLIIVFSHVYSIKKSEKIMQESSNALSVVINKPLSEVFEFTINPDNTPTWISSIVHEEANERPPKPGTIYRNRDTSGHWSEYRVTENYEKDHVFELEKTDGSYTVTYTYTPISGGSTKLEYYEWVPPGKKLEPFAQATLNDLKEVMERPAHILKR